MAAAKKKPACVTEEAEIVKCVGYCIVTVGATANVEGKKFHFTLKKELKDVADRLRRDAKIRPAPKWGRLNDGKLLIAVGTYIAKIAHKHPNHQFKKENITKRKKKPKDRRGVMQIGADLWRVAPPFTQARSNRTGFACQYTVAGDPHCENYPPNYCFNIGGTLSNKTCADPAGPGQCQESPA